MTLAASPALAAAIALLASPLAAEPAPSASASPSAPPATPSPAAALTADRLVARIADRYASETRGTIGYRTHSDLAVDAPMNHRTTSEDQWYVLGDGELDASSEREDPRRPLVHDPGRLASLGEYQYAFVPCGGCPPGDVAIGYSSRFADAYHAHGTLIVDPAAERIVRNVETPYALPWPTRNGVIEITWGPAAVGWFPVAIDGRFFGKVGPFSGVAHYVQRLSPYARYPNQAAAIAALTSATGKPAQTISSPPPAAPSQPAQR